MKFYPNIYFILLEISSSSPYYYELFDDDFGLDKIIKANYSINYF